MEFLAFGRQTSPAAPTVAVRSYPFIETHEERCEACGAIRDREEMEYAGVDEDGLALYQCAGREHAP